MSDPAVVEAAHELGALLTASEARDIAARLSAGNTLSTSIGPVPEHRQLAVRALVATLGGTAHRDLVVAVLHAIAGAKSTPVTMSSVWTVPAAALKLGELTTRVVELVEGARTSVVCATYNFAGTSMFWQALREASEERLVDVTLYVDGDVDSPYAKKPEEVAAHLRRAAVWRSSAVDGVHVRSHAKFLVVDSRYVVTTSANFSRSAEQRNVEFGLRVDDAALATQIIDQMHDLREIVYQLV